MTNIVSLESRRKVKESEMSTTETLDSETRDFLSMFYDWALHQGLDITSIEFKYDSAVIVTMIQSMLMKRNNAA